MQSSLVLLVDFLQNKLKSLSSCGVWIHASFVRLSLILLVREHIHVGPNANWEMFCDFSTNSNSVCHSNIEMHNHVNQLFWVAMVS